uniref:Uncharacterized protein n=1 Tax=Candidatus Kentrum sp. SD TaxID=2126332 RepID=A0A451BRI1_9GAMM|nr:MAG: hypothetical protein BECKSD772D_GA0070982_11743 [Candidatus Kentron sp. SD]
MAWPPIRISSPPAPAEAINESLAECQSALDAVVAAKAALKEAVSVKDGKLEALEVGMKKDFGCRPSPIFHRLGARN